MKRSKRIEALDRRAVNKDGFIDEWPEMGFVAMHSPYDPKPSVKIENNIITELDGKKREDLTSWISSLRITRSAQTEQRRLWRFPLWKLPERS